MLKVQFEVTGPKGYSLRRDGAKKFEKYETGQKFIAYPHEVPESFRDTVKVIGPAPQPSVDAEEVEVVAGKTEITEEKENAAPKPTIKPRRVVRKK